MKNNLKILFLLIAAACLFAQTTRAEDSFFEVQPIEQILSQSLLSPQTVFVVNTTSDTSDSLPGDGFCTDGLGNCSLRAAITEANAFSGANQIDFGISGSCPRTLTLNSPLPEITESVTIDGYSQPEALPNTASTGSNATICVQFFGNSLGSSADGLRITSTAPNTTIRGLAIGNFGDNGIEVSGNGSVIEGNFVGTDSSGITQRANFNGIVTGGTNIRVGGSTLLSRNIASGNTRMGIAVGGASNTIQNNYVGLNAVSTALGNGNSGINIFQSGGNLVGGSTASVRNVIGGNGTSIAGGFDGSGVYIFGNNINQSSGNTIQGNYIGTNPSGSAGIANQSNGVKVEGAINTTIVGNLVSGNAIDGIGITGAGATGNVVRGNIVGLDATRTNGLGNVRDGIGIYQIAGNTIGGTNAGDGNWSAGNGQYGVQISGTGAENNSVLGNFIGFNVNSAARPQLGGIVVFSPNNTIGGTVANARNYVAGNGNWNIVVAFTDNNLIQGNTVGLSTTGTVVSAATSSGIYLLDTTNNTVGGTASGAGNVISGNVRGVNITRNASPTTGNQVIANFIGTNADGTVAVPNQIGVFLLNAVSNTIGGTTATARNIISGNTSNGISMNTSSNNLVQGNYIGTKADGLTALPNTVGVTVSGLTSTGNIVGGTATGAGNLVSGNTSVGVFVDNRANNNRIEGNTVGMKVDGSAALPNGDGVTLSDNADNNVVGGTATAAGNLISGNTGRGVFITAGANTNRVEGNKIGTDTSGNFDYGNGLRGVEIGEGGPIGTVTFGNTIGGTTAAARNIISGNNNGGVLITGATTTGNTIAGNYIGTNAAGNNYLAVPNTTNATSNLVYGVQVNSPNNTIGGATTAHRNVIAGQFIASAIGIDILPNGSNTLVQNNYIGMNAAGNDTLFNGANIVVTANDFTIDTNLISGAFFGINVGAVSSGIITNNRLGTNAAGTQLFGNGYSIYMNNSSGVKIGEDANGNVAPNVVAGGTRKGITVFGNGTGNLIRQNSIYDNADLGIDLGDNGVTQNDTGDTDFANNYQNFPVLTNVTTNIEGTLNSAANRSYRLEFYSSPSADPTGYGEGKTFIASATVTTNGSGNTNFSLPNPIAVGGYISATATDLSTNDTSEFSALKQVLAPTAVRFAGAKATKFADGVLLEWQTGFEANNLGFNVYRENNGKRELLNNSVVAGSSLMTAATLQSGFDYQWFDGNGDANANYYVEAIDLNGTTEIFGAFQPQFSADGKNFSQNSRTIKDLNDSATQETVEVEPTAKLSDRPTAEQISTQNILVKTDGVRLVIKHAGFYRVTAAELFANGLPTQINPNTLALFADGIKQPFDVLYAENGAFEAIEFYGIGTDSTETDARNYLLTASMRPSSRIKKLDSTGSPSNETSYTATVERKDRTTYFAGLLNGDEENFFGAVINDSGINQNLTISNIAPSSENAQLTINLQGLTDSAHTVRVELNGQFINQINFAAKLKGVLEISIPANVLREGANNVRLISSGAGDLSLVENIRLSYPRQFRAVNNSIRFSAASSQEISVGNFTTESVRVFDVTNADNVFEVVPQIVKSSGQSENRETKKSAKISEIESPNFDVKITPIGGGTRNLLAISNAETVAAIERNFPSDLKRTNGADLVIVTKREFFQTLAPLVKLRQSQNLNVQLVDLQDVYDEFNFGQKSTQAVKNFLRFARENWVRKPQYVILAGDAIYDPKNYLGGAAEIVPTRLVDSLTMETASDEWFGDFDGDDVAEFAIGRLPAANQTEMEAIVRKLLAYERQTSDNSAAFVSDVSDGFDFAGANAAVREILPAGYESVDLRRGELGDAQIRANLFNALNGGQKIVSYVGHGSSSIWRGNIFTKTDAQNLSNADKLPIFVTMTCLNGFFQDPFTTSLSEALLKNPNGGAIAVWTATGAGLPDSYGSLNLEIHRQVLNGATLGQAHLQAKRSIANRDTLQTWILLGDPSMRLH